MTPLNIEVAGSSWIDRTLEPNEVLYRPLGGAECLRVERLDDEEEAADGEEVYEISQVDDDDRDGQKYQCILVGDTQPTGHFFVADTLVSITYTES